MANLAEAEKFINLLDECADKFTFQTFDDDKHRKSPQLARWLHGDAVTLHDTLTEYSKAGAGVYVAVQEMEGKIYTKPISKNELGHYQDDFKVISTQLKTGKLHIRILQETDPGNALAVCDSG